MLRFPQWTWLSGRVGRKQTDSTASVVVQSRPCLPAVESLNGRVMLSSDIDPIPIPYPTLAATIQGDNITLGTAEAAALDKIGPDNIQHKHIAGVKYEDVVELGKDFGKVDLVLAKFHEAILDLKLYPGEPVIPPDPIDVGKVLNEIFVKIDVLAAKIDLATGGELVPAVQKVREAAMGDGSVFTGVLGDLGKLQDSGLVAKLPSDDRFEYMKMTEEYLKIDDALIDYKVHVIAGAKIDEQMKIALLKVDEAFGKIKLEDSLVSSDNQVSQDFLDGLQGKIDGLITGNTDGGGGGDTIV